MRQRGRTLLSLGGLALFALLVTLTLGGCSSSSSSPSSTEKSPQGGSAAERAQAVLGHAPTGRAAEIIKRGTVLVANDADFAPQSSLNTKTGELTGFNVDVAKGVAGILGLDVKWEHPVPATVPSGLQKGTYDVSIDSLVATPEAKKLMGLTEPYFTAQAQLFVKKGKEGEAVGELSGKKIGVVAGTSYYDYLKNKTAATVVVCSSASEVLAEFSSGDLEYWLTDAALGQQLIKDGAAISAWGTPLFAESWVMATKKGEADWVALLNSALQKMRDDGSLSTLSKKWYVGIDFTQAK